MANPPLENPDNANGNDPRTDSDGQSDRSDSPMNTEDKSEGVRLPVATVSLSGPPPGRRTYKRRFSNFLLNKSLQLRYIGVVTVVSAVLVSTLGTMIWQQKNVASSEIVEAIDASDVLGADAMAELDDDLWRRDLNWILRLVGVAVGLVLVLFFLLLVMTHKVAGPLYKVSLYFDRMAKGRLGETYPLRRGDMLRDFYDKFKEMHDAVRNRHREENQAISRFIAACEAAGVTSSEEAGSALAIELEAMRTHRDARQEALS